MDQELEKTEKQCHCEENCTCGCQEGKDCTCTKEDGHCQEECHCQEEGCHCDHEKDGKKKKEKKHKEDKKLKEAEEKIKELEDKILREKAEMINYRRRKDEETSRILKYANEDLVKEILEAVDNLERAIAYDDNDLTDELSKFLSGFKMIYCNLVSTLEKFGVKAIDGNNKPFDPTYHQAVMTAKMEGIEPGMVIDVLQKGYLLQDKVIRPAMVRVSE